MTPERNEPMPCCICGSVEDVCHCDDARACPECGEDWDYCECEHDLAPLEGEQ